jgi:hypothetical protein
MAPTHAGTHDMMNPSEKERPKNKDYIQYIIVMTH